MNRPQPRRVGWCGGVLPDLGDELGPCSAGQTPYGSFIAGRAASPTRRDHTEGTLRISSREVRRPWLVIARVPFVASEMYRLSTRCCRKA